MVARLVAAVVGAGGGAAFAGDRVPVGPDVTPVGLAAPPPPDRVVAPEAPSLPVADVPVPYYESRACCPTGSFDAYVERKLPADLSGDRGSIDAWVGRSEFEVTLPVGRSLSWEIRGDAEYDRYHLSDPDAIVPGSGRLIEDTTLFSLTNRLEVPLSRSLWFRAGVNVASTGATGAEFADTLTWGIEGSFRFSVGGSSWVRLGLAYHTILEETGTFWPVFDVGGLGAGGKWEIEWRWNILVVSREVAPSLRVGAAVRYDRSDWRLAESDRVPGGVARDIRYSVGAYVSWVITDHARLHVGAWYDFGHDLIIDDRDGDRVTDLPADNSLDVVVWFTWKL